MIFFLYALKNNLPYSRFAVSVSGKIGNSTRRNYIKRKMKEWFRLYQSRLDQPHDLWVSVKRSFDRSQAEPIGQLFQAALDKISTKQ